LHERLLHNVVGLLPGPQQEGSPVCAHRVPGDQRGIRVKVAVTGPGYRLRVVDGSPRSTGHTYLNTPQAAAGFPGGGRRAAARVDSDETSVSLTGRRALLAVAGWPRRRPVPAGAGQTLPTRPRRGW